MRLFYTFLCLTLITLIVNAQENQSPFQYGSRATPVWSDDGTKLAQSFDNTIQIWDLTTGTVEHTLIGHSDQVTFMDWNSDNTKLVSTSYDTTVRIWDTTTGISTTTFTGHDHATIMATWTPDDTQIISVHSDVPATRLVWDVANGNIISSNDESEVTDLIWSSSETHYYVSYLGGASQVDLFNLDYTVQNYTDDTNNYEYVAQIALNSNETKILTGTIEGLVYLWDVGNGQYLQKVVASDAVDPNALGSYNVYPTWVRDVHFSSDDLTFSSLSADGTFRTWDTATGQLLLDTNITNEEWILAASISPLGDEVAVQTDTQLDFIPISSLTTCEYDITTGDTDHPTNCSDE